MHTFTLTLDGRQYALVADGQMITVDGQPFAVKSSGDGVVLVDGIAYEVRLEGPNATVDGDTHSWSVDGLRAGLPAPTRERVARPLKPEAGEGNLVVAIMPGKVVRILVELGDRISPGDPVCVLEAMKMENELQAPVAGTVTAIHVQPGAQVEKGQVLVELG